ISFAKAHNLSTASLSFDPHPLAYFSTESLSFLSTPEQKIKILSMLGIERPILYRFDVELAQLSPEDFVRNILKEELNARYVFVGEGFLFGHKKKGDVSTLQRLCKQWGMDAFTVSHQLAGEDEKISSTTIRKYLKKKHIDRACTLL